jgi:hypothetical protein
LSSNPVKDFRIHAQFHARESPTGIGAGLPPFPNISSEQVEQGIERFAATLPARDRLRHLLNANPLHIDRDGTVSD